MVKGFRHWKMALYTKANSVKEREKDLGFWNLRIIHIIKEIGRITNFMVKVIIIGAVARDILVNIPRIGWMDKAKCFILMDDHTKETSSMTRNMVKGLSHGLMVGCTEADGKMTRKKARDCSLALMGKRLLEFGRTVNMSNCFKH